MSLQNSENISGGGAELIQSPKRIDNKVEQLLNILTFGFKSKKAVISILSLNGIIGKGGSIKASLSLENLNDLIEKAFQKPKLTAVCLIVNSQGGSPVQSELIAARIRNLAKQKKVPVYSFIEDIAASGGYWLACAGDKIYASQSSIIGSIGVITSGFGFQEAIKKIGIERRVYAEGKNKSVLDPFLAPKLQDIKIIKQLQKQVHEHFINYVKDRRAGKLTQDDEILFNGEFWAGNTSLDYGLIDGIDDIYSFLKRHYGDEVKIEYIKPKISWIKSKLGVEINNLMQNFTDNLISSIFNKAKNEKFNID